MFTGIVETRAVVKKFSRRGNAFDLELAPDGKLDSVKKGDSISVDGTCLTLTRAEKDLFSFDVMRETVERTSLRCFKKGYIANLERALVIGSRLDGHFVLGHVDGAFRIMGMQKERDAYIDIEVRQSDRKNLVEKGSVAINGISLTVGRILERGVRVYLIPYTIAATNLQYKKPGDLVNVEFDILGKYVNNSAGRRNGSLESLLKIEGFI